MSLSPASPLDDLALVATAAPADVYACRQERKLVLDPARAAALRAAVAAHMAVEQWVAGRRKTRIHSIYFDTPDFALYHRAMAPGPAPSLKLRLRAYGDAATPDRPDASRFLEAKLGVTAPDGPRIKRKDRIGLSSKKLARVFDAPAGAKPVSRRKFWKPLLAYLASHDVRPRLTVSYVREAFVDAGGGLRVTFDEGYVASQVADGASPLATPRADLGDAVVVELKFVGEVPAWLTEALEALGLPPEGQPFSKFKAAVPLLFPHLRA